MFLSLPLKNLLHTGLAVGHPAEVVIELQRDPVSV